MIHLRIRAPFLAVALLLCTVGCPDEGDDDTMSGDDDDGAGPNAPVIDPMGEERALYDVVFVTGETSLELTVSATDPDGDELTYSAAGLPDWASIDPATGMVTGDVPPWSEDPEERAVQPGVFDVTFEASDGENVGTRRVSLYVLDAQWNEATVAEIVAGRPVEAGADPGSPVELRDLQVASWPSKYGGGVELQRVEFGFTSQVPTEPGWEDDWVSDVNVAFLPATESAVPNAGAVIEGLYAGEFGETELAEKVCAELGIPVLIIDRGWDEGNAGELMGRYNDMAVEQRDPHYAFYTFSSAHYLRAADALATVIDEVTDWEVNLGTFQAVFTGHSKFGHTCFTAAATAPDRVPGFMASGCKTVDTGAARLLYTLQGETSSSPGSSPTYIGVMTRYFFEPLGISDQMSPDVRVLMTEGTNDGRSEDAEYNPKYHLLVADETLPQPHRVASIANAPHTTQTDAHARYWPMWLRYALLDEEPPALGVNLIPSGDGVAVHASLDSEEAVEAMVLWATDQSDLDSSPWDGFESHEMTLQAGIYQVDMPAGATAFYVEMTGTEGGIASTPPRPVSDDYPLISAAGF